MRTIVPHAVPTEFISRITIVGEEADESLYWLELLTEAGIAEKTAKQKRRNW
jgi:hypothetical protein